MAATASDNVGVAGVTFLRNGIALGPEDTSAPYSITVQTDYTQNGTSTLVARARDAAGNQRSSSSRTVTIANPAPDAVPPTVTITNPPAGSTVSGVLTVSATAADNPGVVGVQFKLDGANLGAEDTAAPYAVSWSTTATANGAHTLTATARDAAGNSTTAAVPVAVDNLPRNYSIRAAYSVIQGSFAVGDAREPRVGRQQLPGGPERDLRGHGLREDRLRASRASRRPSQARLQRGREVERLQHQPAHLRVPGAQRRPGRS